MGVDEEDGKSAGGERECGRREGGSGGRRGRRVRRVAVLGTSNIHVPEGPYALPFRSLGSQNHNRDSALVPNSIMVVYMDPPGQEAEGDSVGSWGAGLGRGLGVFRYKASP